MDTITMRYIQPVQMLHKVPQLTKVCHLEKPVKAIPIPNLPGDQPRPPRGRHFEDKLTLGGR